MKYFIYSFLDFVYYGLLDLRKDKDLAETANQVSDEEHERIRIVFMILLFCIVLMVIRFPD